MTLFVIIALLLLAVALLARGDGEKSAKLTREEMINEAVKKALETRDRLQRDADYAERVRNRFSR